MAILGRNGPGPPQSRSEAYQHQLHGAGEPHDAHVRAAVYPAQQRTQQEAQNHEYMVALYALWYNFVRVHKTLRISPAMAAGIESRLWSTEDVVALIGEQAERGAPRLADRLVG